MTFGWDKADLSTIIKNYEKIKNNIIIHYLNGTHKTIPYTKENENDILSLMIEQATERMNSSASTIVKYKILLNLFGGCNAMVILGVLKYFRNLIPGPLLYPFLFIFIYDFVFDSMRQDKYAAELTKYEIFLSIYEKLEALHSEEDINEEILNMIKDYKVVGHKYYSLNINTIDYFSLQEVNAIKDNLMEYEHSSNEGFQFVKKKSENNN